MYTAYPVSVHFQKALRNQQRKGSFASRSKSNDSDNRPRQIATGTSRRHLTWTRREVGRQGASLETGAAALQPADARTKESKCLKIMARYIESLAGLDET